MLQQQPRTHSILKKPIAPGSVSSDDMKVEYVPQQYRTHSILKKPGAAPPPQVRYVGKKIVPKSRNWMSDLVGKTFDYAVMITQKQRYSHRIVQIDNVLIESPGAHAANEILLSLRTSEAFVPSGYSPDEKKSDVLRVSVWLSTNMSRAIVSHVSVST
jgi:hypothetical protein